MYQKKRKHDQKKQFEPDASRWGRKRVHREQKEYPKSLQKWVLERVSFEGDFWTRWVQLRSKWHHPNDLILGGYVREPKEGEQATHAC